MDEGRGSADGPPIEEIESDTAVKRIYLGTDGDDASDGERDQSTGDDPRAMDSLSDTMDGSLDGDADGDGGQSE